MIKTFDSFDDMIKYAQTLDGFTFRQLGTEETLFGEPQERAFNLTSATGLSIVIDMINSYEFFYKIFNANDELLFETCESKERGSIMDWDRILNVDTLVYDLIYNFQKGLPRVKREIESNERKYQKTRKDQYCYRVMSLERQYHAMERAIKRLSTKNANI